MLVPTPILAEVSDKMMSFPTLVGWNAVLILSAWVLSRKCRALALVPLLFAGMLALACLDELSDPVVGPAIIHELGYGYATLTLLPVLAIVAITVKGRATLHRPPKG